MNRRQSSGVNASPQGISQRNFSRPSTSPAASRSARIMDGNGFENCNAATFDFFDQSARIFRDPIGEDFDAGADHYSRQKLPDRNIKRLRGALRNDVLGRETHSVNLGEEIIVHPAMLDHNTLRLTGGARGVNDEREAARSVPASRVCDGKISSERTPYGEGPSAERP